MNTTACLPTQETTQDMAPAAPWRAVFSKRFGHWVIHHHQFCERGETSTLFTIHTSLNEKRDAAVAAMVVVDAVNRLEPNRAEIEQLHARLTCCCGDDVMHSPWAGHSPVSMYDHALDNANTRIAELETLLAQWVRQAEDNSGEAQRAALKIEGLETLLKDSPARPCVHFPKADDLCLVCNPHKQAFRR